MAKTGLVEAGGLPVQNKRQTAFSEIEKSCDGFDWIQKGLKKTAVLYLREAGLVQHDFDGNDIVLRSIHPEH